MNDTSLEAEDGEENSSQPQWPLQPQQQSNTSSLSSEPFLEFEVYILNQPVQCILISLIIAIAIICNGLIIHNIGRCQVGTKYAHGVQLCTKLFDFIINLEKILLCIVFSFLIFIGFFYA